MVQIGVVMAGAKDNTHIILFKNVIGIKRIKIIKIKLKDVVNQV